MGCRALPRAVVIALALFALTAVGGVARLHAQTPPAGPTLDVTIDRARVTVGDRIAVTLVMRLPRDARPDLSTLERGMGDLDTLLVGLAEERDLPDGQKEVRVRYEVSAFRPGAIELPVLTVPYTLTDGTRGEVTSAGPRPVTVGSVLRPDNTPVDIRDLKPQIDLPYRGATSATRITALIAAALATIAVPALIGVWVLRRLRRVPPSPVPAVPVAGPADAARAELDRIAARDLLDAGDTREFHELLAACVRRYLAATYDIPATALTTRELGPMMERHGAGRWQARLVTGLLSECDAVAFAGAHPARARAESNLAIAYELVEASAELQPVPVGG